MGLKLGDAGRRKQNKSRIKRSRPYCKNITTTWKMTTTVANRGESGGGPERLIFWNMKKKKKTRRATGTDQVVASTVWAFLRMPEVAEWR